MLVTTKSGLKGEIYLSAIGHTLRCGNSTTIDDKYASDPDILWAVSKGMIEISLDGNNEEFKGAKAEDIDVITLKNTGRSILNLSFINKTVVPGAKFALSQDDFNRSDISSLIKNGSIEVVVKGKAGEVVESKSTAKKSASKKSTAKKSASKKSTTKKSTAKSKSETKTAETAETVTSSPEGDVLISNPNKEKTLISENNPSDKDPFTTAFPEADEEGIIFVDNNNEVS